MAFTERHEICPLFRQDQAFHRTRFVDVLSNKWMQQYMKQSPYKHNFSMLQLHRLCITSAKDCHFYMKNEQASVACKMVSPWNAEFLWQYTLIKHALSPLPRSIASRFRASARFAAALCCCSACQPSAVDLQRCHRASVAKAFLQKTLDCNNTVFCPNVARHLQRLDKETFVEQKFSCLGRNTN